MDTDFAYIKLFLNVAIFSSLFLFAPDALAAVTVTSPVQYQTYQRDSNDQADISISGTYTGSPTAIEARFNGDSWVTIDATPTGNAYDGTLSNQAAGQGTLEVRFTNDSNENTSVADVGIGDVFVVAGQSNAQGVGGHPQSYSHATLKATAFNEDDNWIEGNDPTDPSTNTGSIWPQLATLFMADQDVPVAFITTAAGATSLARTGDWAKGGGGEYENMLDQITDSGVNEVKSILWLQGETDAIGGTVTRAAYNTALDTFATNVAADIAGAPTMSVAQIGYQDTGSLPDDEYRDALDAIRLAQSDAWNDNARIYAGSVTYDLGPLVDGIHFTTDFELQQIANRWWAALDAAYYGGTDGRGPIISTATHNNDKTTITLTFTETTTPLLPPASLDGFRVEDDGTAATIKSITRTNNNQLTITLVSAASGTLTVSLGSYNDGAGATVPTDSSAYNLPAEPFIDQAVTDGSDPAISSINASSTQTGATITWITDEAGSSQVEYGLTTGYGSTTAEADATTRVIRHTVTLTSLTCNTTYNYRVLSTDSNSNQVTGSNQTFTTSNCSGPSDSDNASDSSDSSFATISVTSDTSSPHQPNITLRVNQPLTFSAKPPDTDQLKSLRLRVNTQTYHLTNQSTDPTNPLYQTTLPGFSYPGLYPYTLTSDYGTTTNSVKGLIIVETATAQKPSPSLFSTPLSTDQPSANLTDLLPNLAQVIDSLPTTLLTSHQITSTSRPRSLLDRATGSVTNIAGIFDRTPHLPAHLQNHAYQSVTISLADHQGQPLVGATVTLLSQSQAQITNAQGQAAFRNVTAGSQTIKVTYQGHTVSQKMFLTEDADHIQITGPLNFKKSLWPF